MKKLIIAGGRDFKDYPYLEYTMHDILSKEIKRHYKFSIVSGQATGADSLGEKFAKDNNYSLTVFQADWYTHGKAAGPIRNEKMAQYADACIVFWDGKSRGTKNMIDMALKHKLELHVFFY